jgi:hypothetical protein
MTRYGRRVTTPDPIQIHITEDGWLTHLSGVPSSSGLPTWMRRVGLGLSVFLGAAMAIADPSPTGLGLAVFIPAGLFVLSALDRLVRRSRTRLEIAGDRLTVHGEGLPLHEELPLADLLDTKMQPGRAGRGDTLELWTRKGPVLIRVGAHDVEALNDLQERLKSAAHAAGGGWS